MRHFMRIWRGFLPAIIVACALAFALSAQGQGLPSSSSKLPPELKDIGITERLGEKVSIPDLSFRDESGKEVRLIDFFKAGRPVLLNLVYYECPSLCSLALNGLLDSLKALDWTPGKQFELVTVTIDPREGPELAAKKKAVYLQAYGRPEAAFGWHFLTASTKDAFQEREVTDAALKNAESIRKLAAEVGFGYRYDEKTRQFAHGAALFVLTPTGKISRYLYGIEYKSQDLRLALLEASNGKVGTIVDRLLLFCYRYDPVTRSYSVALTRLMQTGGAGTILIFGGYLAVFWRRQSRARRSALAFRRGG